MNTNKQIQNQIFRDGVSQRDRLLRELESDYVAVDERDLSDLLAFVKEYATKLNYYDESNSIKGDWSHFFAGDVEQMVAYINDPQSFANDESTLRQFSQPHLALLFTFLQLLRHPQQQFKALTQRYLNFYYQEVLKLTKKAEVADKINAIFELVQGEDTHLIKRNTLLNAGQDSQGINLNYATDEDIIVNRATVASIKTLFIEKKPITLENIHRQGNKSDQSFEDMLRWAIGRPNQGDKLPDFNGVAVDLNDLKQNIYQPIKNTEQIPQVINNYIENQLFFLNVEDFKYCFQVHEREINKGDPNIQKPTELEWNEVYTKIEKAYRKKVNWQRRNALKTEREQSGFDRMMKLALGHPNSGDSLPEMPNNYQTLEDLWNNLDQEQVIRYVEEQLYLTVEDFQEIMGIKASTGNPDWEEVYRILEKAQVKKGNLTDTPIEKTVINNIYPNSIVDVKEGEAANLQRFQTFGNVTTNSQISLGFAISSPIFLLQSGKRTITLTFPSQGQTLNRDSFQNLLNNNIQPFEIYFSSENKWIEIKSFKYEIGSSLIEKPLKSYTDASIDSQFTTISLTSTSDDTFDASNIDQIIVSTDGKIFKITKIINNKTANIRQIDELNQVEKNTTELYNSSAFYSNSLQFKFTLDATSPAILPPIAEDINTFIDTPYPVVKILLKQISEFPNSQDKFIYYQQFKSILLQQVNIQVNVENIQNIKLRNDNSVLNSKTPFQPLGNNPQVGSSFYFSNREISEKKLDSLTIKMEWMGLPKSFEEHYKAYSDTKIMAEVSNNSFQASLKLLHNRSWVNIETAKPIFSQNEDNLSDLINLDYQNFNISDYGFDNSHIETNTDDPLEQSRYFKLELSSPDFGHDLYPIVLNKVALATDETIKSLTVYPPYTPQVKAISLDYTASIDIDLNNSPNKNHSSQIFHIHPFGYVDIQNINQDNPTNNQYYLLPQYVEEGCLYIGIRNLQPPQDISILFQMVAGSGNGGMPQPQINWSYLNGNNWQEFQETEILADSTNGLIDTGIIRLTIPNQATSQHQLLPSGLHWLRAIVKENITASPDTLDIKTQAVRATFVNQGNADEHLSKPLAANSIQGFVTRDPTIKAVQQPYTSFGGKPTEDNRAFTMRVSERLRHKQRAITAWDYERLLLENFPQIYKVKCINSAVSSNKPGAAKVTLVVVPDISNTAPFFPLEPKAPLYLLKEIEAYLQKYTSPFVQIEVKNPRYERIKYRVGVRFRAGYEQGYYLNQLNEDIKRFLSPWAYAEQADITFGSSIHSSSVIYFIENRPYVDYVTNLKLIEQIGINAGYGINSDTYYRVNQSNLAQVQHPDSILVSAPEHIIDLIGTENYDEEEFEGIDYMIVGIDFVVS